MAPVSDATTAVGADASWFKVNEMGLVSDNPDYWATGASRFLLYVVGCILTEIGFRIQRS